MRADDILTDDVLQIMRERGLRMTPQRRAIVAEVMGTTGHINPPAVAHRVQSKMPGVNLSLAEAASLERLIAKHRGFRPDFTHFAISGLCRSCQRKRR